MIRIFKKPKKLWLLQRVYKSTVLYPPKKKETTSELLNKVQYLRKHKELRPDYSPYSIKVPIKLFKVGRSKPTFQRFKKTTKDPLTLSESNFLEEIHRLIRSCVIDRHFLIFNPIKGRTWSVHYKIYKLCHFFDWSFKNKLDPNCSPQEWIVSFIRSLSLLDQLYVVRELFVGKEYKTSFKNLTIIAKKLNSRLFFSIYVLSDHHFGKLYLYYIILRLKTHIKKEILESKEGLEEFNEIYRLKIFMTKGLINYSEDSTDFIKFKQMKAYMDLQRQAYEDLRFIKYLWVNKLKNLPVTDLEWIQNLHKYLIGSVEYNYSGKALGNERMTYLLRGIKNVTEEIKEKELTLDEYIFEIDIKDKGKIRNLNYNYKTVDKMYRFNNKYDPEGIVVPNELIKKIDDFVYDGHIKNYIVSDSHRVNEELLNFLNKATNNLLDIHVDPKTRLTNSELGSVIKLLSEPHNQKLFMSILKEWVITDEMIERLEYKLRVLGSESKYLKEIINLNKEYYNEENLHQLNINQIILPEKAALNQDGRIYNDVEFRSVNGTISQAILFLDFVDKMAMTAKTYNRMKLYFKYKLREEIDRGNLTKDDLKGHVDYIQYGLKYFMQDSNKDKFDYIILIYLNHREALLGKSLYGMVDINGFIIDKDKLNDHYLYLSSANFRKYLRDNPIYLLDVDLDSIDPESKELEIYEKETEELEKLNVIYVTEDELKKNDEEDDPEELAMDLMDEDPDPYAEYNEDDPDNLNQYKFKKNKYKISKYDFERLNNPRKIQLKEDDEVIKLYRDYHNIIKHSFSKRLFFRRILFYRIATLIFSSLSKILHPDDFKTFMYVLLEKESITLKEYILESNKKLRKSQLYELDKPLKGFIDYNSFLDEYFKEPPFILTDEAIIRIKKGLLFFFATLIIVIVIKRPTTSFLNPMNEIESKLHKENVSLVHNRPRWEHLPHNLLPNKPVVLEFKFAQFRIINKELSFRFFGHLVHIMNSFYSRYNEDALNNQIELIILERDLKVLECMAQDLVLMNFLYGSEKLENSFFLTSHIQSGVLIAKNLARLNNYSDKELRKGMYQDFVNKNYRELEKLLGDNVFYLNSLEGREKKIEFTKLINKMPRLRLERYGPTDVIKLHDNLRSKHYKSRNWWPNIFERLNLIELNPVLNYFTFEIYRLTLLRYLSIKDITPYVYSNQIQKEVYHKLFLRYMRDKSGPHFFNNMFIRSEYPIKHNYSDHLERNDLLIGVNEDPIIEKQEYKGKLLKYKYRKIGFLNSIKYNGPFRKRMYINENNDDEINKSLISFGSDRPKSKLYVLGGEIFNGKTPDILKEYINHKNNISSYAYSKLKEKHGSDLTESDNGFIFVQKYHYLRSNLSNIYKELGNRGDKLILSTISMGFKDYLMTSDLEAEENEENISKRTYNGLVLEEQENIHAKELIKRSFLIESEELNKSEEVSKEELDNAYLKLIKKQFEYIKRLRKNKDLTYNERDYGEYDKRYRDQVSEMEYEEDEYNHLLNKGKDIFIIDIKGLNEIEFINQFHLNLIKYNYSIRESMDSLFLIEIKLNEKATFGSNKYEILSKILNENNYDKNILPSIPLNKYENNRELELELSPFEVRFEDKKELDVRLNLSRPIEYISNRYNYRKNDIEYRKVKGIRYEWDIYDKFKLDLKYKMMDLLYNYRYEDDFVRTLLKVNEYKVTIRYKSTAEEKDRNERTINSYRIEELNSPILKYENIELDDNKIVLEYWKTADYGTADQVFVHRAISGYEYSILNHEERLDSEYYPIGRPSYLCGITEEIDLCNVFGLIYAKISVPYRFRPSLPFKLNEVNKITYPYGTFEGLYFSEELKAVVGTGYKIEILYAISYNKTKLFHEIKDKEIKEELKEKELIDIIRRSYSRIYLTTGLNIDRNKGQIIAIIDNKLITSSPIRPKKTEYYNKIYLSRYLNEINIYNEDYFNIAELESIEKNKLVTFLQLKRIFPTRPLIPKYKYDYLNPAEKKDADPMMKLNIILRLILFIQNLNIDFRNPNTLKLKEQQFKKLILRWLGKSLTNEMLNDLKKTIYVELRKEKENKDLRVFDFLYNVRESDNPNKLISDFFNAVIINHTMNFYNKLVSDAQEIFNRFKNKRENQILIDSKAKIIEYFSPKLTTHYCKIFEMSEKTNRTIGFDAKAIKTNRLKNKYKEDKRENLFGLKELDDSFGTRRNLIGTGSNYRKDSYEFKYKSIIDSDLYKEKYSNDVLYDYYISKDLQDRLNMIKNNKLDKIRVEDMEIDINKNEKFKIRYIINGNRLFEFPPKLRDSKLVLYNNLPDKVFTSRGRDYNSISFHSNLHKRIIELCNIYNDLTIKLYNSLKEFLNKKNFQIFLDLNELIENKTLINLHKEGLNENKINQYSNYINFKLSDYNEMDYNYSYIMNKSSSELELKVTEIEKKNKKYKIENRLQVGKLNDWIERMNSGIMNDKINYISLTLYRADYLNRLRLELDRQKPFGYINYEKEKESLIELNKILMDLEDEKVIKRISYLLNKKRNKYQVYKYYIDIMRSSEVYEDFKNKLISKGVSLPRYMKRDINWINYSKLNRLKEVNDPNIEKSIDLELEEELRRIKKIDKGEDNE